MGWVPSVGCGWAGCRGHRDLVTSQQLISGACCVESTGTAAGAVGLDIPTSENLTWHKSQIDSQHSSDCSPNIGFSRWRGGQQPRGYWSW